jgi:hypothetical protein
MACGADGRGERGEGRGPDGSRPVVLLEAREGAEVGRLWGLLEAKGYAVSWCPGPTGPPAAWCPLLGGRRCGLVESAAVVVCGLGLSDPSCRLVLDEMAHLHADACVIVEASEVEVTEHADLLRGHTVLISPSAGAVADAVDASCGSR